MNRAIAEAASEGVASVEYCQQILRSVPRSELDPPPLLTGDDLVAIGWLPGPYFKKVLESVRDAQMDRAITTKAEAFQFADALKPKM